MISRKLFFLLVIMFLTTGCSTKIIATWTHLDTPEHHIYSGDKLLKSNKIKIAFYEYKRAIELSPFNSPAYVGVGIIYGKSSDFENGFKYLKIAEGYKKNNHQDLKVQVGYMRIYIFGKEQVDVNWLNKVKKRFNTAIKIDPEDDAPYYFIGIAYKNAFKFKKASEKFKYVIHMGKEYQKEATLEFFIIEKIIKSQLKTGLGKEIALKNSISRADLSVLLLKEINLDNLLGNRKRIEVRDIDAHKYKQYIETILSKEINGLQQFSNNKFRPDEKITRSELAVILTDIYKKTTGNNKIFNKFKKSSSPFPFISKEQSYYYAVRFCISEKIMEIKDFETGEFDSQGSVSGADAVLSLYVLNSLLKK